MNNQANHSLHGVTVIGIDIGKDVFHLVGFDGGGKIVLRRKIRRLALTDVFKALPRCVVGMEACLSAHFVSRTLRRFSSGGSVPADWSPACHPQAWRRPIVEQARGIGWGAGQSWPGRVKRSRLLRHRFRRCCCAWGIYLQHQRGQSVPVPFRHLYGRSVFHDEGPEVKLTTAAGIESTRIDVLDVRTGFDA